MLVNLVRSSIVFCLVLLFVEQTRGQSPTLSPEKLGYSAHELVHSDLGTVNYFVRNLKEKPNQPILLYLDGSGPYPLFQRMKQGFGSTLVIQDQQLLDKFKWVLISKPGVPFVDDMEFDPRTGIPQYEPPREYTQRLSLQWRVEAAKAVIDELLGKHELKPQQLIVVGVSEGFQVGAKLAAIEPRITHVGLFVGNGLNQFYDFVIAERMKMERGEQTFDDTQRAIDEIWNAAREIYADPESTEKYWMGHTYRRWSSFTSEDPVRSLLQVDAPIFIACCALDKNTSVLSADYIPLEFLREKRTNLTYKIYPYEHSFVEMSKDEQGNTIGVNSHFEEVFREFTTWLENHKK